MLDIIKTDFLIQNVGLRKTGNSRLTIFERKVLREMYCPVFDSQINEWRKLHNDELQRRFRKPNIIKEIANRRLMWAGHVRGKDRWPK